MAIQSVFDTSISHLGLGYGGQSNCRLWNSLPVLGLVVLKQQVVELAYILGHRLIVGAYYEGAGCERTVAPADIMFG